METIPGVSSQGTSSGCPQENEALGQVMSKDRVLGQVMQIMMKKLNETNKNLNELKCELRGDISTSQDQVKKLDFRVKLIEDDKARIMEVIQGIPVKELDGKRRQIIEDCLGLPTILRRIMEQFSDKELINLSLVNKLWNYEARSVLRDRCCLKATIISEPVCQRLVDFASDLRQMRVVPFSGMHVTMSHSYRNVCPSLPIVRQLTPAYQVILDRLPWKCLSIDFIGVWSEYKGCPALLLVKTILEVYCGVLEELSIRFIDSKTKQFVQSVFQDRGLPRLKILKFQEEMTCGPVPSAGFLKALVSFAPNLREIHISGQIDLNDNVLEGSSAVLVLTSGFSPLSEPVCRSLIAALRVETMDVVCTDDDGGFDAALYHGLVPSVIQASHTVLKTLQMNLLFAVPLMCYGICLENVTQLEIYVSAHFVEGIELDILTMVKGFDFTRTFPNLNQIEILNFGGLAFSSGDISAFLERGNVVARNALPDRAINIKHLNLGGRFGNLTALLLAEMFPHVTKISVDGEFPFAPVLWEHFDCLAELHVEFDDDNSSAPPKNWDSLFCGIFPEEVAELRAKDDEFLEAANIVPVMPSITCNRGLRVFTFVYSPGDGEEDFYATDDPTRVFSKVTGLIGFRRCPNLSVEFKTPPNEPAVLEHMRPYVTLVTDS